jgi:hypothetical protein
MTRRAVWYPVTDTLPLKGEPEMPYDQISDTAEPWEPTVPDEPYPDEHEDVDEEADGGTDLGCIPGTVMSTAKRTMLVLALSLAERKRNHERFVAMHRAAILRGQK